MEEHGDQVQKVYRRIKNIQRFLKDRSREDIEHYTASLIIFMERNELVPDYFEFLHELSLDLFLASKDDSER